MQIPHLASGPIYQWASTAKDFESIRVACPDISRITRVTVEMTTLDSMNLENVTGIKVDAEGAEYQILRGARTLLAEQSPVLSVELEERHARGCTYAVPAFLDALGYDCFFQLGERLFEIARFDRDTMHRAGMSPGDLNYSNPYVFCFYFLPRANVDLYERVLAAYRGKQG